MTTSTERPPVAAILALGLTQIIGYGTLYYSFSILAPDMARDLNWSSEWIFGALSVALLIGGLSAPTMGKWIDRFGAGRVMAGGSAAAASALVACALSSGKVVFVVTLIAIETASNLVQYAAAFALLVQINPKVAQRSITYLTLIAGFASTIFWPITTALHEDMSWREVYLVFAALNLLVCLPVHALLARSVGSEGTDARETSTSQRVEGTLPVSARRLGFIFMVVGFSVQSLLSSAVLIHMVPILSGLGLGTSAALVGSLYGPAQVLSRFTNMVFGGRLAPVRLAIVSASLMSGAIALLAFSPASASNAIAFAVIFGLGGGIFSIAAGTLPLWLFGSEGYGQLQGKAMASRLVVSAIAPFALALAMEVVGVTWSLAITAIVGGIAILAFILIGRLTNLPDRSHHALGGAET
ncbi:arsenite efflux MFS transporter ArsK [Rhizobium sp. CNPSo 4039]|uniref:arsenite efflux MFS transporter ArsK n=1 Tax=Rhizobium sp. CNPSo 4039 TaxID=3021409 RepID=UPI000DDD4C42|nr:arsenite efflux MFS transporter ArsK [Rhizobium sp. CNPSo 4039]MDK4715874.1 arsenite efflux MFS transporter ArsK [Rhizobium sp. CNPSo 4039]